VSDTDSGADLGEAAGDSVDDWGDGAGKMEDLRSADCSWELRMVSRQVSVS